ncbi:DUF1989 domain-containing protein [Geochorda subterranea]|uniref:DUF1989 domain-containing protein n=1 Tax=Geochorda subterranea TaxID=3109564 RepID=UPI00386015EB
MTAVAQPRLDLVLQPVSGKAVPVYEGEILRIIQMEGEQTVDFNCFNLHDYKERMSTSQMRAHGFKPRKGDFIVSNPPRCRPMMYILDMPETCVTDLLAARCDATRGEREYGLDWVPNCQDTLAEAIGEYGLTPDDVHDSFNMWMNTTWDAEGYWTTWNTGQRGDFVDLLALIDVLAVPVICGSGSLGPTSNFSLKPIKIQVFPATSASRRLVAELAGQLPALKTRRGPEDYRTRGVMQERQLRPPSEFTIKAYPIKPI